MADETVRVKVDVDSSGTIAATKQEMERLEAAIGNVVIKTSTLTTSSAAVARAADQASRGFKLTGQGAMQAAYFLDDMQYGMKGVVNNVPLMLTSLGMGMGLAGALSIVAVGVGQVVDRWDDLKSVFTGSVPVLDQVAAKMGELAQKDREAARSAEALHAQRKDFDRKAREGTPHDRAVGGILTGAMGAVGFGQAEKDIVDASLRRDLGKDFNLLRDTEGGKASAQRARDAIGAAMGGDTVAQKQILDLMGSSPKSRLGDAIKRGMDAPRLENEAAARDLAAGRAVERARERREDRLSGLVGSIANVDPGLQADDAATRKLEKLDRALGEFGERTEKLVETTVSLNEQFRLGAITQDEFRAAIDKVNDGHATLRAKELELLEARRLTQDAVAQEKLRDNQARADAVAAPGLQGVIARMGVGPHRPEDVAKFAGEEHRQRALEALRARFGAARAMAAPGVGGALARQMLGRQAQEAENRMQFGNLMQDFARAGTPEEQAAIRAQAGNLPRNMRQQFNIEANALMNARRMGMAPGPEAFKANMGREGAELRLNDAGNVLLDAGQLLLRAANQFVW